jgi:hypothetical protein
MRTSRRGVTVIEVLIVLSIIGLVVGGVAVVAVGGKVDDEAAYRAAEMYGFKESRIIDRHSGLGMNGGCDEYDRVAFDMEGVNAAGNTVPFLVCCTMNSKGCTVRSR